MKILLINQAFYPDVAATAQHLTDFAADLAGRGIQVTVLTGRRSYVDPKQLYSSKEIYRGVSVIRVGSFAPGRHSRLMRVADAFLMNAGFAWRLLWFPRFDKVVALTTPPLVAFTALLFSKMRKNKFCHWMMDINPDEAVAAGWLRPGGWRAGVLGRVLNFVLRQSDQIVVLDSFMKDRIVKKGADPEKIVVIPPWSQDEDLETIPHESNPFRQRHHLQGKFVVMYSGNHSVCHPLDTVLGAALALKNDPGVIFLFVGGGERVKEVLDFCARHNLPNIIHLPYQPRSEIKYSLSAADLHVVVMGDLYVGIVHPCKIYGILKIGRPFVYIGPRKSHIGELIVSDSVGFQVEHGEVERLIEMIKEARGLNPAALTEVREKMQALAEQRFRREILSLKLVDYVTQDSKQ